jgi:hypothetical protein
MRVVVVLVAWVGVKEMIKMSKTTGEYEYPLTPLLVATKLALTGVNLNRTGKDNRHD